MLNKNLSVTKVYFENLNAIRFIAASFVIVAHIEFFKKLFHLPNFFGNPVVSIIGRLGVVLFFVLSGFLISYLLFVEKKVTKTISVKKFYIRRILRIWPLYFLIIILAFFVFPFIEFFKIPNQVIASWDKNLIEFLLFCFLLPNLASSINVFPFLPFASHTWSIGVEEQFYLIWPILIKKIKNRWVLMALVIVIYLLFKKIVMLLPFFEGLNVLKQFIQHTPIDCMAIGGIFALIAYENTKFVIKIRKFLFLKSVQWICLLTTLYLIGIGFRLKEYHYEFYALFFGILIVNFACNSNRIFSMENTVFNYFGKISYGLYMYHPIVIVLAIKVFLFFEIQNNLILLYLLVFSFTILFSSLSYRYFESVFINKKRKYTQVVSGDSAKG
jgi:peptidoglycan/LPS O-acetylase OafA/YrhL